MGDVVEVRNAVVRRGKAVILDNVSWDIDDGQRWVVLGPNGAGKTTLTNLIAGRSFPSSGSVSVIGERLGQTDLIELRQLVGLTADIVEERIPPRETALDVVMSGAYGVTGRWKEQYEDLDTGRARALLSIAGVKDLRERKFGTLSTGERSRVLMARALMPDPELLVLDEPAAGMDLGGREDLVDSISRLASDPRSPVLVLVTHHVEDIPDGFTHALAMRGGGVFARGPIHDVITSETLTQLYGTDLEVKFDRGRFTARRPA